MIEKNLLAEFQLDQLDQDMLAEMSEQSDRGAAIVAFAYLDDLLRKVIQSRLHNYKHKGEDIWKTMFTGAGPLATFSARRRLALMLGIIGLETYDDLGRLSQIRNEFAHRRSRRTFKSQRIRDLCEALKIPIRKKLESLDEPTLPESVVSKSRLTYLNTIMYLCGSLRVLAKFGGGPPARELSPLP